MSDLTMIHVWCVTAAVLCAASCALLGPYLVLRKMSLLGDAISHAILPGLALAFLITGSRSPLPMFIGAAFFGLLTAFVSQFLAKYCRVDQGAALGVVFTTLFAIGVLLIRLAADQVDLDPGCVLYGMLEYTPFDTIELFGRSIPRSVVVLLPTFVVNALFVGLFYKELKLASFDPALATTLGFRANTLHFALMAAVAATSVAAFESVGSILVVAMFIIPAATARLLTDRFFVTLVLSLVAAIAAAGLGYAGAIHWNTSVAGAMATASGALFLVALLFAPRYGITAKLLHRFRVLHRVVAEDILGLMYRCQEESFRAFPLSSGNIAAALGGGVAPHLARLSLAASKLISREPNGLYRLTESGLESARRLVRTHRLWETYLVQHLNLPHDHVHGTATRLEHYTTEDMAGRLSEKTGGAAVDPHGREIP